MLDFARVIEKFQQKELDIRNWHFCIHNESWPGPSTPGKYCAYIMGEGAEQCLASKHDFNSEEEVIALFKSLGVEHILRGVG